MIEVLIAFHIYVEMTLPFHLNVRKVFCLGDELWSTSIKIFH